MDRPPRSKSARLLDGRVLGRAFGFLGPVEAAASLALLPLGAALFFGWPTEPLSTSGTERDTLSTMVFAAIVMMQMANAFECRSTPASLSSIGPFSNRLLVGAVAVEVALLVGFVYLPPIWHTLGQHPLTAVQWLPVLVTPWILLGRGGRQGSSAPVKGVLRRRDPAILTRSRLSVPFSDRPASPAQSTRRVAMAK